MGALAANDVAVEGEVPTSGTFGEPGHEFNWFLSTDGTLTIEGSGEMPDFVGSAPWGAVNDQIVAVVIGDGITSIGNYAFGRCSALTHVKLPDNLSSIGKEAFTLCSSLSQIELPMSLNEIGELAFSYTALQSITIPNSVTTIDERAFQRCKSLTQITLLDTLENIGNGAFAGCSALKHVKLPKKLQTIPEEMFSQCENLSVVKMPNGITEIGNSAFSDCTKLTLTKLPESLTTIGDSAFYSCKSLAMEELPDNVTTIGVDAFRDCSQLALTKLPKKLTSIGENAFCRCKNIIIDSIPDGVTSIGAYAFAYCDGLTSIEIPQNVKKIEKGTFLVCTNLAHVAVKGTLQIIEQTAFESCTSLETITFTQKDAPTLKKGAFLKCDISTIYVPYNATGYDGANWPSKAVVEGAALSDLTVNDGKQGIKIDFWAGKEKYDTINVGNDIDSVTITPTAHYTDSIITVNDQEVTSGAPIEISLRIGTNPITVTVASPNNNEDKRDYKLTIKREAPATSSVTLNTNGGTISEGKDVTAYTHGVGATLPTASDITRDGYTFQGWYENEDFSGSPVTEIDANETGNKTFYAKWQPNIYSVSFEKNGGTINSGDFSSYTYGQGATLPTDVTREGYTFRGWYTDSSCSGAQVTEISTTDTGNKTFYAKWEEIPVPTIYTVTVNGSQVINNGTGSYETGTTVTIDACIRSGYTFAGWTSADGVTFADAANPRTTFTMPDKAVTVTATWTENGGSGSGTITPPTPPTYRPIIPDTDGGTVSVTPKRPEKGDDVTLTPNPAEGYEVDKVIVTDKNGNELDVPKNDDGTFTFTQPSGRVTITVTYKPIEKPEPTPSVSDIFIDVAPDAWYTDAVQFAYDKGLMTGTSDTTFSPELTTTRGMIVAILHRLEGSPVVSGDRFIDIADGDWYTDAVNWAASEDIVNGMSATTFAPNAPITREQLAAILYNYAEYKGMDVSARADLSRYTDADKISSWAEDVLSWAVSEGLIGGMTADTVAAQGEATRAQVAAILQRFLDK